MKEITKEYLALFSAITDAMATLERLQAELAAAESSYKKAIPELDNVPFW